MRGWKRVRISKKKHIIDIILSSPRTKLSQSDNFTLDYRDTKESSVDFVCALKRKNTNFPVIYFTILKVNQLPPKFVTNMNAWAKDRGTWIPFKI